MEVLKLGSAVHIIDIFPIGNVKVDSIAEAVSTYKCVLDVHCTVQKKRQKDEENRSSDHFYIWKMWKCAVLLLFKCSGISPSAHYCPKQIDMFEIFRCCAQNQKVCSNQGKGQIKWQKLISFLSCAFSLSPKNELESKANSLPDLALNGPKLISCYLCTGASTYMYPKARHSSMSVSAPRSMH